MLNPYNLEPSEPSDLGFEFTTEAGQQYYIYFHDLSAHFFGSPVFDFGFVPMNYDPNNRTTRRTDYRIAHTVCSFIDDFLHSRDCIVLFYPLNDGRGAPESRNKVFDGWYDRYNEYFKCQKLQRERIILTYGIETIIVTVYCKNAQIEIAQKILFGDPLHLINSLQLSPGGW